MAFDSDASNIVANDSNGVTDVFIVNRAQPWGQNGTPWKAGSTKLISAGFDGSPANGPSYRPAVSGDSRHLPRCVAFLSDASNLVPGDTNGVTDAFVYNLATAKITRVSVGSAGAEANGPTSDVSVDGACERVAFSSSATNLALTATAKPGWKSSVSKPASGKQVYIRIIDGQGYDAQLKGLTFLGSQTGGTPGNADSYDVDFARAGKAIVFTSLASNLTPGDSNGVSDIYERTLTRSYKRLGNGKGTQQFLFKTRLVSATRSGQAGNGASLDPSSTDDGRYVAYETTASNLLAGDSNGASDIAEADLAGRFPSQTWVSKSKFVGRPGNGDSNEPTISDAGEFVFFSSAATNLKPSASIKDDSNGVRDMFLWNRPTGNVSTESRDSENRYLRMPAMAPATSSRGNYVLFESSYPLIDLALSNRLPNMTSTLMPQGGAATDETTAMHQVYLRYEGAK